MPYSVTIENEYIRAEIWPQTGGKISSVIDKADGYELLFTYPAELPQGPQYDMPYSDSWYAGWDECFPAVAAGKYPGHPFDGIGIPDHGELWGLPTTALPAGNGITTTWNGLRFGYRLKRRLWLDGATLAAEYALSNLSAFDLRFVWAVHALMAMDQRIHLQLPDGQPFRWSHDAEGKEYQRPFNWPRVGEGTGGEDVSHPSELPPRRGWKVFSTNPIDSPLVVGYPGRGRTVRIEYAAPTGVGPAAYWGIWINTGGWAGHRHVAIEPTTGRFDQLDRSVKDGSAGRVGPLESCQWSVRWTLGPA